VPSSGNSFQGSLEKNEIRKSWDLPLIVKMATTVRRRLAYFGMPGPEIEDVRSWKDHLAFVTAVEYLRSGRDRNVDLDRHRQISSRLSGQSLSGDLSFQVLRGDVDDIILKGLDNDGTYPQRRAVRPDGVVQFRYDLVNLDYCGGIAYKSKASTGPSRRVRALQKLFERQEGIPFVLLLSFNVRQMLDEELTSFLRQYRRDLDPAFHSIVDWYAGRSNGDKWYKLKAAVPLYVHQVAEQARFKVRCLPPVAYVGTGAARMIHFAFELLPTSDEYRAFSTQGPADLLRQPLLLCANGRVSLTGSQHVGFDWQYCLDHLDYVPDSIQEDLRRQAASHLRLDDT